ncbi:MAG TPA: ABC transporter permease, partial [Pseudorhizobium sp.]|nr:ABC transporter permease [Pseudorhizobium sp.]
MTFRVDRLGVVIAALAAFAAYSPFATVRANRIVQGEGVAILEALPVGLGWLMLLVVLLASLVALFRKDATTRLLAAAAAFTVFFICIGNAASHLTPADNSYARVSPASGFWLLLFTFSLLLADGVTRMRPSSLLRLLYLGLAIAILSLILLSGLWGELSLMKEYTARADVFWLEAFRHLALALGSLAAAAAIGVPLGIVCDRVPAMRAGVVSTLNIVQTIPAIA